MTAKNSLRMANEIVVAVDGPSASGKGTISELVACKLGFAYLDSGMLYRAVAYELRDYIDDTASIGQKLCDVDIERGLSKSAELRTDSISHAASKLAQIEEVRHLINNYMREYASNMKKVIIDGRDIGTVVFPDASCKFYVTASLEIRAHRRFIQLQKKRMCDNYNSVLVSIANRDERDMSRSVAPLNEAGAGYIVIDTSNLTIDETVNVMIRNINDAFGGALHVV